MQNEHTMIIACATVIEEMLPIIPPGMRHQTLEFGLHVYPDKLRTTLQATIDELPDDVDTVLLGYGLCSRATVGLQTRRFTLVIPLVDDCISIFLGAKAEYQNQNRTEPGSYYLTKGWIEAGATPLKEIQDVYEKYGPEKAARIQKMMLRNYKRLAYINTGQYEVDRYRETSRKMAEQLELRYEEIKGSDALVKKLIDGAWNEEFLVLPPGETVRNNHFFPQMVA